MKPPRHRKPLSITPPSLVDAAYGRYPTLTTDQEVERIRTALHEAAHFVAATHCGIWVASAYVRVPGRTPRSCPFHRGREGYTDIRGQTYYQDVFISAVALLTELAINPEGWEQQAASDVELVSAWGEQVDVDQVRFNRELDRALLFTTTHWPAIDGVASALLDLGDRTGVVKQPSCSAIKAWIDSNGWQGREPVSELPIGFRVRASSLS